MIKNILFAESAVRLTLQYLRSTGYTWSNISYINKKRYAIVYGKPNIAILLKTEPFFNFGWKFREQGQKGVGDSINCKHFRIFEEENVHGIYTMFRDGKLYYIPLEDFKDNSFKWMQKEGTEVYSISIHRYQRVNAEENNGKQK